jgi:hypothetical protein
MGLRFRRSIALGRGLRLNVGKRNASIGIGPRAFGLRVGTAGNWIRAGLPGSGLSYSARIGGARARGGASTVIGAAVVLLMIIWAIHALLG